MWYYIRRGQVYYCPHIVSEFAPREVDRGRLAKWTHNIFLARRFHSKYAAGDFLAASDLPKDECDIVSIKEVIPDWPYC